MSAAKSERLLNLVILLLVARNYTTKEQIRALMEPYRESSDEAFDRMFERDKDDLRALGIPLEVGFVDKFFEDEQGYRIKRDAFELPEIDFAADEVAVLGLAARVWRHAGLAAATSRRAGQAQGGRAQLRPRAARPGGTRPRGRGAGLRGDVAGDRAPHPGAASTTPGAGETRAADPAPPALGRGHRPGTLVRRRARHRPRRAADVPAQPDRLERDRRPATPAPTRSRRAPTCAPSPQSLAPRQPDRTAVVLARPGAANGLRRRAEVSATGVTGPDGTLGLGRAAGALRLGDRLRRRAARVRRRGGRRVARRAARRRRDPAGRRRVGRERRGGAR